MYMFCKEWLKQKANALKSKITLQGSENKRNLLIRGTMLAVLFLAVSGLYVFQNNQYEVSAIFDNYELKTGVDPEAEKQNQPVFVGENDYWLEPEEPSGAEAVPAQATLAELQAGQAVEKHNLENAEANNKNVNAQNEENEDAVAAMAGFSWPVLLPAEGEWSKLFGYAYDDTWQDYRFHKGVDMSLAIGVNVVAVWDGKVESISQSKNQGTVITLKHEDDLQTVYIGLSANEGLKEGALVAAGANLGTITEAPLFEEETGPHLHFEIWEKGKAVDPLSYLP